MHTWEEFLLLEQISNCEKSWPQPPITCSKLTVETIEQGVKYCQCLDLQSKSIGWGLYDGVVLVSVLLNWTYFTCCSSITIVNFEHVIAGWTVKAPSWGALNMLLSFSFFQTAVSYCFIF